MIVLNNYNKFILKYQFITLVINNYFFLILGTISKCLENLHFNIIYTSYTDIEIENFRSLIKCDKNVASAVLHNIEEAL